MTENEKTENGIARSRYEFSTASDFKSSQDSWVQEVALMIRGN